MYLLLSLSGMISCKKYNYILLKIIFIFTIYIILGPYKLNGVPLRRVNQRYVIATSTKVPLTGVNVKDIDDKFFAREKEVKKGTEDAMFEGAKATVISPERKAAQTSVDAALVINIEKMDTLSAYISAKFSLSKADKPHTMIF